MRIAASRLTDFQTCPIGAFDPVEPVVASATSLLAWTTLETFNGRQVPLEVLRKKFVYFWHQAWPENVPRDGDRYWAGVRAGRGLAAKLFVLFRKYDVRRPVQGYELCTGGHVITGEYAVLVRRMPDPRVQDGPYVLIPHAYRPITYLKPDLASLAAWKHAMMHEDYSGLGIYHLPLLRGERWRHLKIQEPLVLPWLEAAAKAIAAPLRYPTPSGYCESCTTRACLRVFHE